MTEIQQYMKFCTIIPFTFSGLNGGINETRLSVSSAAILDHSHGSVSSDNSAITKVSNRTAKDNIYRLITVN